MNLETLRNHLDEHSQIQEALDTVEMKLSSSADLALETLGRVIKKSLLVGANLRDKADDVVTDIMFNPFEPISEMTIRVWEGIRSEIEKSETAQAIPGLIAAIPETTVRLSRAVIEELCTSTSEKIQAIKRKGSKPISNFLELIEKDDEEIT